MNRKPEVDVALDILQALLGDYVRIESVSPVGGGSISEAFVLTTSAGRFFAKGNHHPLKAQFAREVEGLQALYAADSGLQIPKVHGFRARQGSLPAVIVMACIEPGARSVDSEERLGRGLAQLHRCNAERFGFEHDNYCGATPQINPWTDTWGEFYRDSRIGYQLGLARSGRSFTSQENQLWDALLEAIPGILSETSEPPSLIHGDLWSGNVVWGVDGPCLIDPAAYYGHREAEIGMMLLFGGFSPRVFESYQESWPLPTGWERRVGLYKLYHILNHSFLFGGGYWNQAVATAREALK